MCHTPVCSHPAFLKTGLTFHRVSDKYHLLQAILHGYRSPQCHFLSVPEYAGHYGWWTDDGNDKRCPPFCKNFQRFLHHLLTLIIQRGRGLIKNQDRRIFQKHTGNGQTLLLPRRTTSRLVARYLCHIHPENS